MEYFDDNTNETSFSHVSECDFIIEPSIDEISLAELKFANEQLNLLISTHKNKDGTKSVLSDSQKYSVLHSKVKLNDDNRSNSCKICSGFYEISIYFGIDACKDCREILTDTLSLKNPLACIVGRRNCNIACTDGTDSRSPCHGCHLRRALDVGWKHPSWNKTTEERKMSPSHYEISIEEQNPLTNFSSQPDQSSDNCSNREKNQAERVCEICCSTEYVQYHIYGPCVCIGCYYFIRKILKTNVLRKCTKENKCKVKWNDEVRNQQCPECRWDKIWSHPKFKRDLLNGRLEKKESTEPRSVPRNHHEISKLEQNLMQANSLTQLDQASESCSNQKRNQPERICEICYSPRFVKYVLYGPLICMYCYHFIGRILRTNVLHQCSKENKCKVEWNDSVRNQQCPECRWDKIWSHPKFKRDLLKGPLEKQELTRLKSLPHIKREIRAENLSIMPTRSSTDTTSEPLEGDQPPTNVCILTANELDGHYDELGLPDNIVERFCRWFYADLRCFQLTNSSLKRREHKTATATRPTMAATKIIKYCNNLDGDFQYLTRGLSDETDQHLIREITIPSLEIRPSVNLLRAKIANEAQVTKDIRSNLPLLWFILSTRKVTIDNRHMLEQTSVESHRNDDMIPRTKISPTTLIDPAEDCDAPLIAPGEDCDDDYIVEIDCDDDYITEIDCDILCG